MVNQRTLAVAFAVLVTASVNVAKADVIFFFAESGQLTQATSFQVAPGDNLTVDLVASLGLASDSLSAYGVSVQFDTNELDVFSTSESLPAGFQFNLTVGVSGVSENIGGGLGQVSTFEAGTNGLGPIGPTSFKIGSITFAAVSPSGTAADIDLTFGFFTAGIDGAVDNADPPNSVSPSFGSAAVLNSVPEPNTLLALSLSVCAIAARRRRKS